MASDKDIITQTFADYVQAFQTLDPRSVFSYCHIPCMFMRPRECW